MHPRIDAFDARVDRTIEPFRTPIVDRVAYSISSAADHSLLWFIVGAARSVQSGDLGFALRFAAAMGVESAVTNGPVKTLFRRTRPAPETADGPLPYGMHRPITSSFPSGHATAAFTAAVLLSSPRNRVPWYALASVVAASRVYVRMHHASDVVAGAGVGMLMGYGLKRWVRTPGG